MPKRHFRTEVTGFHWLGGHLQASKTTTSCSSQAHAPPARCISLTPYLELFGEVVSHYGGEGGEEWSQEHAHIPDVNGDVEEVQHVVNRCRCDHQACGVEMTPGQPKVSSGMS